ncbi:MAG: hypothetical protein GQ574_28215 [Crocinitomix sp.]|nr:hypothetical protein [Crocinitomix sp.]
MKVWFLYILFFTTHLSFGQNDSTKCALLEQEFENSANSLDEDLVLSLINNLIDCDSSDGYWISVKGQFMWGIGELDSAMDCFMRSFLFCNRITAAEKAIELLIEYENYESALMVIGNAIKQSKSDHNKAVFYSFRAKVEERLKMFYLASNDYKTAYKYNPSELTYLQEMTLLQLDIGDAKKRN